MATKTLRKRVRVLLSNQETVSVNLIGAKVPKTVTVTKEIVVGHVVNCICTVVGGPTGGRCDLSKTPADAPYLIEPYRWPTTLRNIVKELRKIYPKLKFKKSEVMGFYTKSLEKLAESLVKRVTNPDK